MRTLTRYILKGHFLPFFYALLILIFLLFTNFLLRAVDKLLGKGLSFSVIVEFLFLNTAWIVALAAPMAVLVATLMTFGRLAEDNEITALRVSLILGCSGRLWHSALWWRDHSSTLITPYFLE